MSDPRGLDPRLEQLKVAGKAIQDAIKALRPHENKVSTALIVKACKLVAAIKGAK